MKNVKFVSIIVGFIAILAGASAFNTNFSFVPASGTDIKLYCETPIYFMIDGGTDKFNGFSASIKFDPTNIQVITGTIHSEFPNGNNNIVGNLYNVGGAMQGGFKQGIITGVIFHINTKNNISSTTLSFVRFDGIDPTYGLDTTDDGISLNGFVERGRDILTSVTNATYNFVALPCNPDNKQPTIGSLVKFGTTQSVNNKNKIASGQKLSFETYDWDSTSNNKVSHWFSGASIGNLSNYVSAPNNVDNQEGVNSGSITVKVSCASCSGSPSNMTAIPIVSDWNGTNGMNALTWDSERRGYNVSFNPPFPYEVEKQVTVNISVTDNPNEYGQTHTKPQNFYFNAPVAPNITRIYPTTDTFVSPSKSFRIKFYISDDWAGVDTGSIVITTTYSGKEFVYSGSDLYFQLTGGGQEGLGNAGSYIVSFEPKEDFPVLTEVTLYVTGSDLAGSTKTLQSSFTTRPECSFFGCIDSVNIIGGGINEIFTGIILSVTGTNPNSPYPYLTGENNEILMCGKDWSGTAILGNIYLYDASGNRLNNVLYTGNNLHILVKGCNSGSPSVGWSFESGVIDIYNLSCVLVS